mmetsp:Transcript_154488/g.284645  ORF Transcript_154488/g.284645 Transcript_154488/m.284645 type:complete len:271 (+) Transcript_154488:647-1459(+)
MVFVFNRSVEDFWFNWLRAPHASLDLSDDWLNVLMNEAVRYRDVGLLTPPPHACLTCCATGVARQRVIFVQNPFSRLESAFRMLFLTRWSFWREPLSQPSNFSTFVRLVLTMWRSPPVSMGITDDGHELQQLQVQESGRQVTIAMTTYDWAMIKAHTESVAELAGDKRVRGRRLGDGALQDYFVVHLETQEADLERLQSRLCRERCYCRALPPLPQLRRAGRKASAALPAQSAVWTSDARAAALLRYSSDFLAFGYSDDPGRARRPELVS